MNTPNAVTLDVVAACTWRRLIDSTSILGCRKRGPWSSPQWSFDPLATLPARVDPSKYLP
ncbi:MAG TPA: hypothetical protein VIT91_20630 [Chthoniobacterales bacterium]